MGLKETEGAFKSCIQASHVFVLSKPLCGAMPVNLYQHRTSESEILKWFLIYAHVQLGQGALFVNQKGFSWFYCGN